MNFYSLQCPLLTLVSNHKWTLSLILFIQHTHWALWICSAHTMLGALKWARMNQILTLFPSVHTQIKDIIQGLKWWILIFPQLKAPLTKDHILFKYLNTQWLAHTRHSVNKYKCNRTLKHFLLEGNSNLLKFFLKCLLLL